MTARPSPVFSPPGLAALRAYRGEKITVAKWNALVQAIEARRIIKGRGVRVHELHFGTIINLDPSPVFSHPWHVIIGPDSAHVTPGLINGMEATIGGKKLSETTPPVVTLSATNADDSGNSWIALEITMRKGNWRTIDKAEVVQCANIEGTGTASVRNPQFMQGIRSLSSSGANQLKARYPLARLIGRGGVFDVFQVAYFNVNHIAKPPSTALGVVRHFFWPA